MAVSSRPGLSGPASVPLSPRTNRLSSSMCLTLPRSCSMSPSSSRYVPAIRGSVCVCVCEMLRSQAWVTGSSSQPRPPPSHSAWHKDAFRAWMQAPAEWGDPEAAQLPQVPDSFALWSFDFYLILFVYMSASGQDFVSLDLSLSITPASSERQYS